MKDLGKTGGKVTTISSGQSVGNQSAGNPQPNTSIVTTLPSCKNGGPLAGKD